MKSRFKYFEPHDHIDCGPTCLRMIAFFHGRKYSSSYLQKVCEITRQGVSLKSLALGGKKIGLKAYAAEVSFNYFLENAQLLPCILYWDNSHFVVLHKITKSLTGKLKFHIADPGTGKVVLAKNTVAKFWLAGEKRGYALFLEPQEEFYNFVPDSTLNVERKSNIFKFLNNYFTSYRKYYSQILVSMLIAAIVALFIPYLTQSIIDYGVANRDISFIVLILAAQFTLFVASTITEIIRSHLLVHIGARINLNVLSDFLAKILKLPLRFFDSKLPGDIIARISDHQRVSTLISASTLTAIMSFVNLFIYVFVIADYSWEVFLVYIFGSYLSIHWTILFMRWRKSIDYQRFRDFGSLNDKNYEIVHGIVEIKLNNYEKVIRHQLERINYNLFKNELSTLKLEQYQSIGTEFINQIKNIIVIYLCAKAVIDDSMTIGIMLTIIFIMGQLNIPIRQFINIINIYQSGKIGVDRMNEIFLEKNEIEDDSAWEDQNSSNENSGIDIKNLSFHFPGQEELLFDKLNLNIPKGKTTAIVGTSGSGKTTLLKLMLNFYTLTSGTISINGTNLKMISPNSWRKKCGTVMQDGFLFSNTIKSNIILSQDYDIDKLINAVEIASIDDYIAEQAMHFETKIGQTGIGLSAGQKQRIMIARAVYKDPDFLFLDEATSSLDSKNERTIMENLNNFLLNRTVVIVAHRLSTVKNADQIVVLEKGKICEVGTHTELVKLKGFYFDLIRNQLELDGE